MGVAVDGTLTEAEVKAAGVRQVMVLAGDRFGPFLSVRGMSGWYALRTVQNRPTILGYLSFENLLFKLRGKPVDGARSDLGWQGDNLTVLFPGNPQIRHLGPAAREWVR